MNTFELAKRYVALVNEDKHEECLKTLFAPDAVSVEPWAPPGMTRTARGLEAIRTKGAWWDESHIVHKVEISGPYPHGDRFAVRFLYDLTIKSVDKRITRDEIGLFTVEGGKIVREEFFYAQG